MPHNTILPASQSPSVAVSVATGSAARAMPGPSRCPATEPFSRRHNLSRELPQSPMTNPAPTPSLRLLGRQCGGGLAAPQRIAQHQQLAGGGEEEAALDAVEVGEPSLDHDQRAAG